MLVALLLVLPPQLRAERTKRPPADFEPLTSLPWKEADATLEKVLNRIFLEPAPGIRYPVLGEYFRTLPVEQLGRAFDLSVNLEGAEAPDDLVEFLLPIWAKRDPRACWNRTQQLFDVVGIEEGWLGYDSWKERVPITVQNVKAIQASPFYLSATALKSFPLGVDQSALPKKERVELMREFAQRWFRSFHSWPGYERGRYGWPSGSLLDLSSAFATPIQQIRERRQGNVTTSDEIPFEIGLRRWLKAEPASAIEIMQRAQETKWPATGSLEPRSGPSTELLMVWAKADLPAMIRWAETLDLRKNETALNVRGFLMSRVDAATRERWLADAKSEVDADDETEALMISWAVWDLKGALEAAIASQDPQLFGDVANQGSSGPWAGVFNTCHFNLGVIKDFDVMSLPPKIRTETMHECWYEILETWGNINIGETARYGVDYLLRTNYAPRDRLMRLFSGHDEFPDEGDMIDRTFCALRVWAVIRPGEMKKWIGTLDDKKMREALTWLCSITRGERVPKGKLN